MGYDNNEKKMDSVYSKRIKAGKRRTYFFDVKATRANDYYLTITESRKRFNEETYERHKIFLYKEDFNKFIKGLADAVDYVKTDLMPDFDFDAFSHEFQDGEFGQENGFNAPPPSQNGKEIETSANKGISVTKEEPKVQEIAPEAEEELVQVSFSGNGSLEEVDKW